MLTQADNILLARTGPRKAMGALVRRFWQPVALAHPGAFRARGGGGVAASEMTPADVMRARFGHEFGLAPMPREDR